MLAAVDDFRVVITGKGGHGARPHDCIDPIAVGVQVVSGLQTLVAREIDPTEPAVVTVGAFLAGEASNVIPNTAELRGTLRSFSPAVRVQLQEAARRLVTGVAAAMRAEASFELIPGYPATVNDAAMAALVREVAAEVVGADGVIEADRRMGAEDFSYFLEQRPGCFWFVGTRNSERGLTWGGHHPKFDIDEEAMAIGIETMCRVALHALADG
jgi:amidohydrolase